MYHSPGSKSSTFGETTALSYSLNHKAVTDSKGNGVSGPTINDAAALVIESSASRGYDVGVRPWTMDLKVKCVFP